MRVTAFVGALALVMGAGALTYVSDSSSNARKSDIVRVGVLPDQDAATLKENFEPLLGYLAAKTGREFQLVIPDDYQKLVTLFEERNVDLAYFGGLTFVQARQSSGAVPLVMRKSDTRFTTSFIVRNEAPWNECRQLACEELERAVMLFGSQLSTSGHLMPRYFLQSELEIVPEHLFSDVQYSGAHDQTAMDVRSGRGTIGAMNSSILSAMVADGRITAGELFLIWETPPYPDYVWAVQEDTDRSTSASIRDAFLALSDPGANTKGVLEGLQAASFVPASARDFDLLLSIAQQSGLLGHP